jgi:hypothetical protein
MPAKDTLDVWPALPLIISGDVTSSSDTDNVIAALEQNNRVSQVELLNFAGGQIDKVLAAMHAPFPELTRMYLVSGKETPSAIPDSFLGGSAPSLRGLLLVGIPLPGLPNLLLSANHLVDLRLFDSPHSGYISPEAIVTLISALSTLDTLYLEFLSPQSCPDSQGRSLPPPKRITLPLEVLHFKGVTEYLEALVTRIDAPQLNEMDITFFNQIDFYCPRLAQFINCTPTLKVSDGKAYVRFNDGIVSLQFQTQFEFKDLGIAISCIEPDWQVSSIEQVCNFSLHSLSTVEHLYITRPHSDVVWKNDAIENTLWLQLLRPFSAVKNLYISTAFMPGIAATLNELVGGGMTEILPSLQKILVESLEVSGPVPENIQQFVAARQLSGRPIAISIGTNHWS